jgi:hypothetical protein
MKTTQFSKKDIVTIAIFAAMVALVLTSMSAAGADFR